MKTIAACVFAVVCAASVLIGSELFRKKHYYMHGENIPVASYRNIPLEQLPKELRDEVTADLDYR